MDRSLKEVRAKLRYLPKISDLLETRWKQEARSIMFLTLAVRQWPMGKVAETCPSLATMGAYHLTLEQKLYGMFYYTNQIEWILQKCSQQERRNGILVLQFKNEMTEQFFLQIECYLYPFFYTCVGVFDILAHEINLLFTDPPERAEDKICFSEKKLLPRFKKHRPDVQKTVESILRNPKFEELKCYRNRSTHRTLISFSPDHIWNRKNGGLKLQLKDISLRSADNLRKPTWKVLPGEKTMHKQRVDYSNRVIKLIPYLHSCQDYIVSSTNDITKHILDELQCNPSLFKNIDKYLK